jgi:hypothetical protein
MVVVDTLAMCFGDGDENTTEAMNKFMRSARQLQQQTGATVIIVHHTTKASGTGNKAPVERGSGALRGGADVMIFVKKTDDLVVVRNQKQKDAAPFEPFKLRLRVVPLGVSLKGNPISSCVLVPDDGARLEGTPRPTTSERPVVVAGALRALSVLAATGGPMKSGDWRKSVEAQGREVLPGRTFQNWRKALLDAGLIEPESRNRYQISEKGRAVRAT